jgi:hypothetical protein
LFLVRNWCGARPSVNGQNFTASRQNVLEGTSAVRRQAEIICST